MKNIDTSAISDYPLRIKSSFYKERKELRFAPIIFAKDNTKALVINKIYNIASQTGSSMAWFFERDKKGWKMKDMQVFSTIN